MPSEMKSMELLHGRINLPGLQHADLQANWIALKSLGSIALFEEAWGALSPCWHKKSTAAVQTQTAAPPDGFIWVGWPVSWRNTRK